MFGAVLYPSSLAPDQGAHEKIGKLTEPEKAEVQIFVAGQNNCVMGSYFLKIAYSSGNLGTEGGKKKKLDDITRSTGFPRKK